jgi:hypothetical protein
MTETCGANLPNSVADVSVPFPWLADLRHVSPVTDQHSYLIPYWYRAGPRWVLYDAKPRALIQDDELQGGMIEGWALIEALEGPPPRELSEWKVCPFVSDVQHELYRLHRAYARPFWVLQGDAGGHQCSYEPWQVNVLQSKGLPDTPPAIGALPPCPFDGRVTAQLHRLNRLFQLGNSLRRLKASSSAAFATAEMDRIQAEIREAELAFVEQQMTPIVDMVRTLQKKSDYRDIPCYTAPGEAGRVADAFDEYRQTGNYTV